MEVLFYLKRFVTCAAVVVLTGCSTRTLYSANLKDANLKNFDSSREFQTNGTIVLSRLLPAVQSGDMQFTLLGFLPATERGNWLAVDRARRTIKLMNGENVVLQTQATEGVEHLPAGNFSVMLKQRAALWYAPDSYFTSRGIPTPPEGSKERMLRGALGDFVLFIDEQNPLHEGPVWSAEIGGVRLEEADISRIYYQLEVGSLITVE